MISGQHLFSEIDKYTILVSQRNYSRNKVSTEIIFAQKPELFIGLPGCVSKRNNQGLNKYQQNKGWYNSVKYPNQPQSYLNIKFSRNNSFLECFYLRIQVGSTDIKHGFGLSPTFVTWDIKVTSRK